MQHCSCYWILSTCSCPCAFANTAHHALSFAVNNLAALIHAAVLSDVLILEPHTTISVTCYFTATIDVLYYFTIWVQTTTHVWLVVFVNEATPLAPHVHYVHVLFPFHCLIDFVAAVHFIFLQLLAILPAGVCSTIVRVVSHLFHDICELHFIIHYEVDWVMSDVNFACVTCTHFALYSLYPD